MRISTTHLEAFQALEKTLQFSAAAERCHISTSAFSQMIGRLEEALGVRLFDRSTRHVALTPEGEVFSRSVKRIANEIDHAMQELQARIDGRLGMVRIASTPTPCVSWLPRQLRRFRAAHPGISLHLHDATSAYCLEMLQNGSADLGIIAQAGDPDAYSSTALFDEPYYLLCPSDDPLAQHPEIPLSHLKGRDYVELAGRGHVWETRKQDLEQAGVAHTGLAVNTVGTLVGLVEAGFGIGLVPQMSLPLCRRDGLVALPIADQGFVRRFYLVHRKHRSLSLAARQMAEFLAASEPQIQA